MDVGTREPSARAWPVPADTPRQGSPLSLRLVLLVGAVSVPLILLGAGALRLEYEADRDRAEAQLVEQARSLARLVDGEFDRVETAALTLAASSTLARGDLSAFAQEMSAARNLISGGGTEIALYDLSGLRLLGPARPGEETRRDAPDLAYVRAAIASGQPRKSDLIALPGGRGLPSASPFPSRPATRRRDRPGPSPSRCRGPGCWTSSPRRACRPAPSPRCRTARA